MMTRFRTYCRRVLPVLLLAAGPAAAQIVPSGPLTSDPARAIYAPTATQRAQHRATALPLPFFDDFTSPLEGTPSIQRWQPKGGALVNNRFALRPLTRGTATLDGLKANGQSYSPLATSPNAAIDSLWSQPIDLNGLTATDRVVLSFAWQAGSIVGIPDRNFSSSPVKLELFVKTNTGVWESKWVALSTGQITSFRQQTIALDVAKYLHGDFQFMFVATGNTTTNTDTWNLDYILLNRNRNITTPPIDTIFVDAATGAGLFGQNPSGGLRSPLRRFASMPVWQFNGATSSELNPALGVNVTNLNSPLPISVTTTGTVQDLASGSFLGNWLQNTNTIPSNNRQTPRTGAATSVAIPNTAAPKNLRYKLYIDAREPVTSPTIANDTIFRDVELNNYYAYDDGTAEGSTLLYPYANGQQSAFAYRFDLNQPDYVRGLRLYPVFTTDVAARPITVSVWGDLAGRPDPNNVIATKTYTIRPPYPTGWKYYQVDFDQPVRVTGTFYVGFSQPSTGRYLEYAADYNSNFPPQHFLRRDNSGAWDTVSFVPAGTFPRGALMMRPVMTNSVATATASAQEAAAYGLYPNPAHGTVTVTGPAFARATVLDALGRTVWEQPAAQAGKPVLPLPTLPPGVYTVRLTLADGRTVGRRLMLE